MDRAEEPNPIEARELLKLCLSGLYDLLTIMRFCTYGLDSCPKASVQDLQMVADLIAFRLLKEQPEQGKKE